MPTSNQGSPRLLTREELANFIKLYRQVRGWSQEQLADISGLSVRTIQRVEQGAASGLDTRRAMAKAFDFEDIDVLNKPITIPTEEDAKAMKEKFERENVTLEAIPLINGRQLAGLVETNSMDLSTPGFTMNREAEVEFAALVDYLRDYRDCADMYGESQKFEVYDAMQAHIDALNKLGVSLRYAVRKLVLKFGKDAETKPMPTSALYIVTYPLGKEPKEFATPRSARIGL